ncbi:MAG: BspA family leucine-rich repeat surface protein, partial [Bacteroidota bacterium]
MKSNTLLILWSLIFFIWQNDSVSQDCSIPDNIQQANTNDVFDGNNYGQSFTATCNGTVKSIRVYTDEVTQVVNGRLKFYNEVPFSGPDQSFTPINGANGQAFNWGTSSTETMQTIELSTPLAVTSGQDYTFILEGTIGKASYSISDSFDDSSLDYTGGFLFGNSNNFWTRYNFRDLKFEVNYTDVVPPVARCKNVTLFLDADGNANLSVSQINNGSSGGVVAFELSENSFDCSDLGDNTITLTVFDNASNVDSCQATVTVVDNIDPVNLTCPDNISREECNDAIVTYDIPTFSDNTDGECPLTIELVEGLASGALFPVNETTTVTYRATDADGNTAECSFTVFIGDTVFPILNGIPNNQTVNATGTNCEGFIPFYNTIQIDNCSATLTQTEGIPGTGPFPLGVTTNTFELEDAAGNITTKSFTVTVVDNQDPVFDTCPSNGTYIVDPGQTTANITFPTPTATDFCGGVTVTQTSGLAPGSDFPIGDNVIEFTATDDDGNTSVCSFTYTVLESSPLIITGISERFGNASIELYATSDIADLSLYAIGVANGGGGSDGQEYSLSGSATTGQFLYLARNSNDFENFFGFVPDFVLGSNAALNPSGDDAVELFINSGGTPTLVDAFGDINVDGTGTDWDYQTSWAYRINTTGPDGGFSINNWRLPGGKISSFNTGSTNTTALIPYPIGTYGQAYDNVAPTAVCLNQTVTVESSSFEVTGDVLDGGSTDNEEIVLMLVNGDQNEFLRCDDGGTNQFTLTVYDAAGNKDTCVADIMTIIGPSQVLCRDITVSLNLNGNVTVNDFDIFNGSEGPCIGKGATLYLTETDPGAGGSGGLFTGETTISSPTDDLFNSGIGIYYQEFSFTVPSDGLYTPGFSFIPTIPDEVFLLALVYDQPVVPNSGNIEDRPEFLEGFFYAQPSTLIGSITGSDNAEVFLSAGTTYYMQVALVNVDGADPTPVTGTFDGDLDGTSGDGSQLDSITYTADDLGENTLYLVSIDELGRFSYCESTVTVVENRALPIYISEYQPNTPNSTQELEIYGTPGEAFSGAFVVIQGNTDTSEVGVVKNVETFAGTFDANGLLVTTIQNITDPTHTVVLTSSFSGTVDVTDIDTDDDGVADDLSAFGVILDAVGVGDGGACCPLDELYGTDFGGINLPSIGGMPSSIFREASIGDYYQISASSGNIFDSLGNPVDANSFDVVPDGDGTFGSINPSPFATSTRAFVTTWQTDNRGNSGDDQITIYTDNTLTYDYSIDWGDGDIDRNVNGDVTHTYDSAGSYTIRITGTFPRFTSNASFFGDSEKLLSIDQWGTLEWTSFEDAFRECENMDLLATDIPNLSNVITMRGMFSNCQSMVANSTINDWDVSNVQDMMLLFVGASNFNQPLNNWNVSNVTNMEGMFNGAETFNQDLNSWNTSQVETMRFMFTGALDFNQPIDNWNVSNVLDMGWMFNIAESFNQDLNNWNVSQVQDMFFMFLGATDFNGNISSWNPAQVTTMYGMFQNAVNFNQDISGWNVSQVIDMGWMLNGATLFNQPIGNWDVSNVELANEMLIGTAFTTENYDDLLMSWSQLTLQDDVNFGTDAGFCLGETAKQNIITNHNWNFTDGGLDCSSAFITTWKTDNQGGTNNNSIRVPALGGPYNIDWGDGMQDLGVTGPIEHTYGAPGTYDVSITGDLSRIYFNNSMLITTGSLQLGADRLKILDVKQWGDIQWTNMDGAFWGCQNMDVTATDIPNLSNVTRLSVMFAQCFNLVGTTTFNSWDVSNITDMRSTFAVTRLFNQPLNNWNVSNVDIMFAMFEGAEIFNQPLNNWNVSNVNNMGFMFTNAKDFNQNINNWNVSNVTEMTSLFQGAEDFNQPLNNWNVSNTRSMNSMFQGALAFDQPLNTWNVSQVRSFVEMFSGASSFNQNISNWNVSSAEFMLRMFQNTTNFNQPLNNWNVSAVRSMWGMFSGATAFNQPLNNWNVAEVEQMKDMFTNATVFDQDLSSWDLSSMVSGNLGMAGMFNNTGLSTENYDSTLIGWATLDTGETRIPTNVIFNGGSSLYCDAASERQELIDTYGWGITDGGLASGCSITLVPYVFLQGAALNPNTGEENLMRDDLRVAGLIPTTSPYGDGATVDASVFNTTGQDAIVDWVFVELRDKNDNTQIVASSSALLQRDSDVLGTDLFALTFNLPADNYYVVVKHRNHLGIMSASPISLFGSPLVVDFTDGSVPTFGTDAQTTLGMPVGVQAMWAGDANSDSVVQYLGGFSDSTSILSFVLNDSGNFLGLPTYAVNAYSDYDIDMDGVTQYIGIDPELPFILQNVLSYPANFLG